MKSEKEVYLKTKSEESFASNEPKKHPVNTDLLPEHAELLESSALVKLPDPKAESVQSNILTLSLVKQDTRKPESTLETSVNQDMGIGGFHTSFENLNSTAITLITSNSEGIQQPLETQVVLEIITNYLANPHFTNDSVEIKSAQKNAFIFSTITPTVKN